MEKIVPITTSDHDGNFDIKNGNIVAAPLLGVNIYRLEDDGRLILEEANSTAGDILCVDSASLTGRTFEDVFPSLAQTEIPRHLREAASIGKLWSGESAAVLEGEITSAYLVHAYQIAPRKVVFVFSDIKEKKLEERKTTYQNLLLMKQQEVALDGILLVAREGKILSFNKKFIELWQIPEELIAPGVDEPVLNWVVNKLADPRAFLERVKYLYAHENEASHDELELKDGRVFKRYSSPVTGEDHGYIGRVWYFRDITEEKKKEESIRKSESDFRGLFEATPTGAVMLVDRKFKQISSRFSKITGYSADDLIGEPTREVYPDDEMDEHVGKQLYLTMRRDGIGKCEARLKRKDGTCIDVLIFASPIDPDDFTKGVAATLEDLTERKKTELERERLREELIQSQKMESIGRLAGGIAHDFNNLLTAIMGNAELAMLSIPSTAVVYSNMTTIMQAAKSAAELTGQLLDFSRKKIIDPATVNLNDVIERLHKMLVRLIGENITLRLNLQSVLCSVRVDVAQVQQILINLTVNARDAMPDGGMLNIETASVILDDAFCEQHDYPVRGQHAMLAVSDTGVGMSTETMERLFEPFYTTKEIGKGTGLGLATVYGAVKQNSGIIHVYSEPGKGSSFKVYFPAVQDEASPLPKSFGSSNMPTGTETVLLVEDNPLVLQFSESALLLLGYKVIPAKSGEEALMLVKESTEEIHLLMTDVILSGINGWILAEKIRQLRPGTAVLFNSGYTENAIVAHGVLREGVNFIGKPFSAFDLSKKIREVLDKK